MTQTLVLDTWPSRGPMRPSGSAPHSGPAPTGPSETVAVRSLETEQTLRRCRALVCDPPVQRPPSTGTLNAASTSASCTFAPSSADQTEALGTACNQEAAQSEEHRQDRVAKQPDRRGVINVVVSGGKNPRLVPRHHSKGEGHAQQVEAGAQSLGSFDLADDRPHGPPSLIRARLA